MTILVEVGPVADRTHAAFAPERAQPEEDLHRVVGLHVQLGENTRSSWSEPSFVEPQRAAGEWIEGRDSSIPLLPAQAISRESFYESE